MNLFSSSNAFGSFSQCHLWPVCAWLTCCCSSLPLRSILWLLWRVVSPLSSQYQMFPHSWLGFVIADVNVSLTSPRRNCVLLTIISVVLGTASAGPAGLQRLQTGDTEQHKTSNSKAFFSPTNHTQNYRHENQEKLRDLIYKITYFKDPIKRPANQGAKN